MNLRSLIASLRLRWHYRNVASLADLANLIADRNSTVRPVGDDAGVMYDALVALGRAGFAVVNCWPGGEPRALDDGATLYGRAAVTGFASTELKDRLDNALYEQGNPYGFWVYEMFAPTNPFPRSSGLVVTRIDDVPGVDPIGAQMDAKQIRRLFPVRRKVRDELHSAWLVTVFDQEWGRSDLFRFLLESVATHPAVN